MIKIQEIAERMRGYTSLSATYDVSDDKLRFCSLTRLSKDDYNVVSELGFKWAPKQECFYALWSPLREDFLVALCDEIGDEDTTPLQRAEARAERFEQYSEHREQDAQAAQAGVDAIAQYIPPGQPILVGHHSEKHHRRDLERMDNGMRRSVNMWAAAEYWKMRAQASLAHAQHLERPDVRHRRIKKLQAQIRRCQKEIEPRQAYLCMWEEETDLTLENALRITRKARLYQAFALDKYPRPADKSQSEDSMSLSDALENQIITPQMAKEMSVKSWTKTIAHYQRWIDHLQNRITYEQAMMREQVGELIEDKWQDMQVGGKITVMRSSRAGWHTILKLNRRNGKIVSVKARDPAMTGYFSQWKYTLEDITAYQPPDSDTTPATPVLCNYPGEGIREITSEEWNKTPRDYKGISTVTRDDVIFRVRRKMFYHSSEQVFLSDKKVVHPPKQAV